VAQDDDDSAKKKPSYWKYAFQNPYNYSVMAGFASAAVLTQNWWLALLGAGAEALWMLFAPDSRLLKKLWFDPRFSEEQNEARKKEFEAKFKLLPETDALRCMALREKQEQILNLAKENPAFTSELLGGELTKLDALVQSFIELSVNCARYNDYLKSIDVDEMERDLRRYQQILDRSDDDEKRSLAQKNLAVVGKRKEKYAEIKGYLSNARGQLELIENSFRLIADQIVTMRSPGELSGQLDELLDGVEAVQQTAKDTERILQAIER